MAALLMKSPRSKGEDDGDHQKRPGISLVQREHVCVSAKGLETLSQGAPPASEHRRVAQREAIGFGLAQLLNQIEEIRRIVRLKDNDKFLIVETERVSGVQFHRAILRSDAQILVHHLLSLLLRARIPLARSLQGAYEQIVGLSRNDVYAIFGMLGPILLDIHRAFGHRKKGMR